MPLCFKQAGHVVTLCTIVYPSIQSISTSHTKNYHVMRRCIVCFSHRSEERSNRGQATTAQFDGLSFRFNNCIKASVCRDGKNRKYIVYSLRKTI